jgi:hypothetical protein
LRQGLLRRESRGQALSRFDLSPHVHDCIVRLGDMLSLESLAETLYQRLADQYPHRL